MEEKKRKKLPLGIVLLLILLSITVLLSGTVLGLWLHGRNTMQEEVAPPQKADLVYNGQEYVYRQGMINLLLMGIDADGLPTEGVQDQADVLILSCLDPGSKKMTLINLSRDILCDLEMLQSDGTVIQTRDQLALAYAYGGGLHDSCRLTCDAVSGIVYGLPIHGYGA